MRLQLLSNTIVLFETFRFKMIEINVDSLPGMVLMLLVSSPARSDIPILYLCHEGNSTSNSLFLDMNTSLIAGTNGSCSCLILLPEDTALDIYPDKVVSPDCDTVIQLTDDDFNTIWAFNGSQVFYTKYSENGSRLWIFVTALGNTQEPVSGTLRMRTNNNTKFQLKCLEANMKSTTTSSAVKTPSLINTCTTRQMVFLSTTTKVPSSLSTETKRHGESSQPNKTANKKMEIPVGLIAGCTVGGVAIVVLIIIVVAVYRWKRVNRNHEVVVKQDDATGKTQASRLRNNDYATIENELYSPSDDIATFSEISLNDNAASEIAEETNNVMSPNGDIYTIVNKSINITDPPKSRLNHETAPTGDVYAVVDKSS